MYISKSKVNHAKQQFNRGNEIAFAYQNAGETNPQHSQFVNKLYQNSDFEATHKSNKRKFRDTLSESVKGFSGVDYFFIAVITLATGLFGGIAANFANIKSPIVQKHHVSFVVLMSVFALLCGAGVGLASSKSLQDTYKEYDDEHFYALLSVRLFDIMRKQHPDLDENLLKNCTPEMTQVIAALLIKNMSEEDTREIISLARDIVNKTKIIPNKDQTFMYLDLNRRLENAVSLVQSEFVMNPTLQDTILSIYRGNVPATFAIKNKQKTK